MPKRNTESEYSKAVAHAEREARFFVASEVKATVPAYRIKLEQDISELQLAWRDMSDEEKSALKADVNRKARSLVRQRVTRDQPSAGNTIQVGPERDRQLDALYRAMTPEDRAQL